MIINKQIVDKKVDKQIKQYGYRRMAKAIEYDVSNLHKMALNKKATPNSVYEAVVAVLNKERSQQ